MAVPTHLRGLKEIAGFLGLSVGACDRQLRAGEIPGVRRDPMGGKWILILKEHHQARERPQGGNRQ